MEVGERNNEKPDARKKLVLDEAEPSAGVVPPPPPHYVSPRVLKKQKKEATKGGKVQSLEKNRADSLEECCQQQ